MLLLNPPFIPYTKPITHRNTHHISIHVQCWEPGLTSFPETDKLWTLVSDAWDEIASSTRNIRSMIESVTRRMKSAVEEEGFWASS